MNITVVNTAEYRGDIVRNWFLGLLVILGVLTAGLQNAEAQVLKIPDCNTLDILWNTRYFHTLKIVIPVQVMKCEGPSIERAFAEAAYILENTRFRTDRLKKGTRLPPANMLKFSTAKYKKLIVDDSENPWADLDKKNIHFPKDTENLDGFSVVGNIVHEARHLDNHLHEICWTGPNKGLWMCDRGLADSFNEGGAHSHALLYLAWIGGRSNWPRDKRIAIKNLTRELVQTRINAPQAQKDAWIEKYIDRLW